MRDYNWNFISYPNLQCVWNRRLIDFNDLINDVQKKVPKTLNLKKAQIVLQIIERKNRKLLKSDEKKKIENMNEKYVLKMIKNEYKHYE